MLNDTQRKFVEATLRGAGPKEAAIAAGLSPDTAGPAGARMRKHAKVIAALEAVGFATPGAPQVVRAPAPPRPEAEQEPELDDLPQTTDSLEFLEAVQANPRIPLGRRMEAAKTLLPFQHAKIGEKGKKETKADGAKQAAAGTDAYATRKPPKLTAVSN
jgi:phage terminase small subunit